MSKLADFFSMTRRERNGTLVVAALLAIAIAVLFCVRSCNRTTSLPANSQELMNNFKEQVTQVTTDSTHQQHARHENKKQHNSNKRKSDKKAKPNQGKQTPHEHNKPLDKVPSF